MGTILHCCCRIQSNSSAASVFCPATPWKYNTSGFANSSEYRQDVDKILREEPGPLYVGIHNFYEALFGGVVGLEPASEAVLKKCMERSDPLFTDAWVGWPQDANQDGVLSWLSDMIEKLATFAEEYESKPTDRRRALAQPNIPIRGSTGERKMDIGFVNNPAAKKTSQCHWNEILVPGELKSNPSADIASKAWLALGRYAREVFAAQDNRRLGFTLCGSIMRIWEFDRFGGIAGEHFDIHKAPLRFVSVILGFLWMTDEQLGFDPTIITKDARCYIEIYPDGKMERLIIDEVIRRAPCIAGRATTCWKAHRDGHPGRPLVIKDSWQYPERLEEGELLYETTNVINVVRHYYHETVRVSGTTDDIWGNVRKGLDIRTATNDDTKEISQPDVRSTDFVLWPDSTNMHLDSEAPAGGFILPPPLASQMIPTQTAETSSIDRIYPAGVKDEMEQLAVEERRERLRVAQLLNLMYNSDEDDTIVVGDSPDIDNGKKLGGKGSTDTFPSLNSLRSSSDRLQAISNGEILVSQLRQRIGVALDIEHSERAHLKMSHNGRPLDNETAPIQSYGVNDGNTINVILPSNSSTKGNTRDTTIDMDENRGTDPPATTYRTAAGTADEGFEYFAGVGSGGDFVFSE
ncbi:hypothetical protein BX600DRAFT_552924 [Xylariales sp. PMI_506]|nr:hypothetical protein BX600DRAFT_552924 [Xylariales sp. PMI_506]